MFWWLVPRIRSRVRPALVHISSFAQVLLYSYCILELLYHLLCSADHHHYYYLVDLCSCDINALVRSRFQNSFFAVELRNSPINRRETP